MQNLFVCAGLKSVSLVHLPGGFDSYAFSGESLYLEGSFQKKEIRLEERKCDSSMYIAEGGLEGVRVYGHIQSIMSPVLSDFYIPMPLSSFEFYHTVSEYLHGDIDGGIEKYFSKYVRDNSVPFYPVPLTTLSGVFKYYNFKEFKSARNKTQLVRKIKIEESMPEPNPATEEAVKKKVGSAYESLKKVFEGLFKERAIWPIKGLEKHFKNNPEAFKMCKWSAAKNILPCIAYTYSTGPWKKLWIRYGYDPTGDPEAYKYQVYVWKNISKAFVIMDRADVYQKIKETEGYRQSSFNVRTGFLTEKALNFLHKKYSEISVPESAKISTHSDLFDGLDFETLDN
ncbi:hypothetical protein NEMIN01_2134 [Nematocida minor]|uniref:uncharacterized protein n=1 Tax=Nematocida minor TaxID=1912983 RepID=UPI0022207AC3|nr:uncharacterized protein NEMIN01_2134 [Nematocida minor]KAI5192646.1 hypothetical protein NEMIN01_2134 [Nematocida minor]